MSYLGTPPQSGFITTAKQRVTSSTNAYVDLDHAISSIADVIVFVNFVKQDTTNLTLTTSTRITLGATLVSSDIVEIHYLGKAVNTQTPATGTVTNDMLAGSIANSKLTNSSITLNGSAVSLGGSATISSNAGTEIVYADRSGDQSSIAHNTWTKVEYNSEQYDPNSLFSTSQDRYVVPSDGRYFFHASANFFGQIKRLYSRFYVNGSAVNDTFYNINGSFSSGTTYEFSMVIFGLMNLSASDYVEAYVNLDIHSGTGTANQVGTQFLAFRLD